MNLIEELKALKLIATWLDYSTDDCARMIRVSVEFHAPHLLSALHPIARSVGAVDGDKAISDIEAKHKLRDLSSLLAKYTSNLLPFDFLTALGRAGHIELGEVDGCGFRSERLTPAGLKYGASRTVPKAFGGTWEKSMWYEDTFPELLALIGDPLPVDEVNH